MKVSFREVVGLLCALMIIAVILFGGIATLLVAERPAQAQNRAQADIAVTATPTLPSSPWRFEANTSAWAVTSGDHLTLTLSFENFEADPKRPTLSLQAPDGFRLDLSQLPVDMTWSAASREILWQPTVTGFSRTEVDLRLDVVSTTRDHPDKMIVLDLALAGKRERFSLPVWAGSSPVAQAQVWPERVAVGQELTFSSSAISEHPLLYTWDLGDGRLIPADQVVTSYTQPGIYTVELQAANRMGSYSDFFKIEVFAEPVAYFKPSTTEIGVNQPLQFTHLGGGLGPLSYWWDFGDGSFSKEQNPSHSYPVAGRYLVQHKVINRFGEESRSVSIVVGDEPEIIFDFPGRINAGERWIASAENLIPTETRYSWLIGLEGTDKSEWLELEGATVETVFATPGRYILQTEATSRYGVDRRVHVLQVDQIVIEDGESGRFRAFTPERPIDTVSRDIPTGEIELSPVEDRSQNGIDLLFYYINQARKQAGVPPVRFEPALAIAAQIHTDDMATHQFTGHTGSDGSAPLERAARGGYQAGGYAGETTAWGFDDPLDVVNFWLSSPGHKEILLNPYASQVGVAQTINYNAERVWYWTAEFGADQGSVVSQMRADGMRLVIPAEARSYRFDETVIFNWAWPLPLNRGDRFVLYLENGRNQIERVGAVSIPLSNEKPYTYGLSIHTLDLTDRAGSYDWFVRLIDSRGNVLSESVSRGLRISGVLPSPTPTLTPAAPTVTPSPTPTAIPAMTTMTETMTPTSLPIETPQLLNTPTTSPSTTKIVPTEEESS